MVVGLGTGDLFIGIRLLLLADLPQGHCRVRMRVFRKSSENRQYM